ncbi:TetR/AcrR family transcriptional regulator [Rouxiella badensis]|jgi:AcrR family transcriptional regulator|uniref:TetR family transcriptional regulator n=1 Tax=Rouxiella badensis TaxID=1646377 RepID=A0A1X0WFA8_9GAMM|nr:TetR/AcrR family transcriptional regulator [Rouxiella badensis]QOI55030.1 TetR/AcrR family transcriptional regulator [Rouxiella badensis subsp. acadiensis]MCC3701827.1 TetR/AcrR family transcriptional regulator [Rouxiella badensis]MCC3719985.1 TetR/AcrR family transcriptional regulator [Rouxiella badensis]MCC3731469.1 TetR/AcrR family transcriptional regulator [Rouxiella badensis]MCC3748876.1 TetR/AcrR family transcriptional regulator [Rouxiella badensis]
MAKTMRSDTERNRKNLIQAGARLFEVSEGPISMTEIANEAGVSVATAYRQFASVEEVLNTYRQEVGQLLLEYSQEQTGSGLERLEKVSRYWIKLVRQRGAAMVPMRNRRGYLERLWEGAEYLLVQANSVRPALRDAMAEMSLPDIGDKAVFLWNILFDPREIFDLLDTVGLSEKQVGSQLMSVLIGGLQGFAHANSFSVEDYRVK